MRRQVSNRAWAWAQETPARRGVSGRTHPLWPIPGPDRATPQTCAARDLVRSAARELAPGRPTVAPVRSYEEHVARALQADGFREAGTAMLFVKELAIHIEEPALAPAVVR